MKQSLSSNVTPANSIFLIASRYPVLTAIFAVATLGILTAAVPVKKAAKKSTTTPKMSPAMMQKAMQKGAPGQHHAKLKPLVGEFSYVAKMWMEPGADAVITNGKSTNTWVLNKRFVMQQVTGDWSGQPFEGVGYIGYDNVKEEVVSMWIDSMSTGMLLGSGKMDSAGNFDIAGSYSCPISNGQKPFKAETKITGPNTHTYATYNNGPNGKPYKAMEISYTRSGTNTAAPTKAK